MVDMPRPVQLGPHKQGKHACNPGVSEDLSVWDIVTPPDTQDALQAVHVECLVSFFLSGVEGPRLTAIQKCAKDAGCVYYHFRVRNQFAFLLHSLRQCCEDGGRSTDPPVYFGIK